MTQNRLDDNDYCTCRCPLGKHMDHNREIENPQCGPSDTYCLDSMMPKTVIRGGERCGQRGMKEQLFVRPASWFGFPSGSDFPTSTAFIAARIVKRALLGPVWKVEDRSVQAGRLPRRRHAR